MNEPIFYASTNGRYYGYRNIDLSFWLPLPTTYYGLRMVIYLFYLLIIYLQNKQWLSFVFQFYYFKKEIYIAYYKKQIFRIFLLYHERILSSCFIIANRFQSHSCYLSVRECLVYQFSTLILLSYLRCTLYMRNSPTNQGFAEQKINDDVNRNHPSERKRKIRSNNINKYQLSFNTTFSQNSFFCFYSFTLLLPYL